MRTVRLLLPLACAVFGTACGRIGIDDYVPDDAGIAAVDAGRDATVTPDASFDGANFVDAGDATGASLDASDATLSSSDAEADAAQDAGVDAGIDAGIDAGFDAGIDAGFDAGVDAGSGYYDVTDSANWAVYDASAIDSNGEFSGAVFDGRYVYFTPGYDSDSIAVRYDTQAPFGSATSWQAYDTGFNSWGGSVYDGRHVIILPYGASSAVEYDTSLPFMNSTSWTTVSNSVSGMSNIEGASFDGRYIYAATNQIHRYDTTAPFTSSSSWTTFDPGSLNPSAADLEGGFFVSPYAFFTPDDSYTVLARYDTSAPYGSTSSWLTVNLANFSNKFYGFGGAQSDGHYLYLPSYYDGAVARYDMTASLTASTSWTEYDIAEGANGAGFDGRFIYVGGNTIATTYRYDTTLPYTTSTSWQSYTSGVTNIGAMVFDGHYMYFASGIAPTIARFHVK